MSFLERMDPDAGLSLLKEGNQRFVEGRLGNSCHHESREASQNMQRPFAIIVACSDSRVSPELIFDQTFGQIFVVRVAGNVVTDVEQDSIDYAALFLEASLIVVLGHESCGAVTAVLANQITYIPTIAAWIKKGISQHSTLEEAVKENVNHGIEVIRSAKVLEPLLQEKKLKIVGGYYSMKDGKVNFF